jgi:hypothetical protein
MKKFAVLAFALFLVPLCYGQSDGMVHVKSFPGGNVGAKIASAMLTCPAAPTPCILVIDASLASAAAGTTPSLCGNCYLYDFRTGPPSGFTSLLPYYTSSCGTGSDESVKLAGCITADVNAGVRGRTYAPSENNTTMTWTQNPFAPLSVSSGQPTEQGSFKFQLQPNVQVTADAEVDLGFDSTLDCGNGYPGGGPTVAGTFIKPEASGYPTTTLISLGTLATNATAFAVQGSKLVNCGLSANGVSGMTAVDESQSQEGAKAVNNRMFGFKVCLNGDANATDGGNFHFWGNFDNQCEMSGDSVDTEQWGARYGYNKQGGEVGILQNFSAIGGGNPTGIEKVGVENDGNGLYVGNFTGESLTYGVINHFLHSSYSAGNTYDHIGLSNANAAASITAWDANTGPDNGSIWTHIQGPNTNLLQSNEPSAVVVAQHGDPELLFYSFDSGSNLGNATVLTNSPQVANSNLKLGDSYSNAAAFPALDLPAKTASMTISANTFEGDEPMTAADQAAGLCPEGIATNGDIVAQTTVTVHAMALTSFGPAACIFDGATVANDYVAVGSAVWNGSSAIPCHDAGTTRPACPIGRVQKTVSAAPSAPSAPTVTTNCASSCTTSYSYKWVVKASTDPLDHTQSAGSTAGTVSSAAVLTSTITNSISGCSAGSGTTPCELFETAGPHVGWLLETINTSSVTDNGIIGTPAGPGHGAPLSVGVIDPPVHVRITF